ncbi:MAG: SDR family oxidoreductase [Dehalobacterium sp.]
MEINLKNKVAVVTGGTAGIGLAIAETFVREGAMVAICSTKEENVLKTLNSFRDKGFPVYGEAVDVSIRENIFSFADNVEKKFGGIDIWVSNAGIYPQYKIIETPEETWQKIMDINVKSVYYGGLIAADKLKKRGGGVLINGASFTSLMPSVGSGGYSASKAAILSMTKTLASELAPYNIRVNCYIPGIIETNMTKLQIKTNRASLERCIAMKRFGSAQDVANGVLFLVSDLAAYITGTFLEISGGKYCVQNAESAW